MNGVIIKLKGESQFDFNIFYLQFKQLLTRFSTGCLFNQHIFRTLSLITSILIKSRHWNLAKKN